MAKLHIKLIGDDNLDINVSGIKNKNKYKYTENNISVTVMADNDRLYIDRICNEYTINLVFDKNCNTESTYTVFGGTKKFILNTITNKLKISDNKIELEYSLEGNKFKYLLEVVHEGKIKKSNKWCFR